MALEREEEHGATILAELLREVSGNAEVFVLLWSGASALFQPDTKTVEKARARLLAIAPGVRCELDRTAVFSHDHHQKAVTIDGRVAYVGGMDLSTFQGDRWDTAQHPLRYGVGWHDVQVRLEGEVVEDVESNFCQRWKEAVGDEIMPIPPASDEQWNTPCQLIRTIPPAFYPQAVPKGHFGIRHALLETIAAAREFIYLENQYLWAPEIVDALCKAMDRQDPDRFRIVVLLPAKAHDGRYDNDNRVRKLVEHDAERGIFAAYTLYSSGPAESLTGYRYSPIYIHSKTTIVDDAWLIVGSANLNRRGLATDSEIAVQAHDPSQARTLRLELWSEHLGVPVAKLSAHSATELIDGMWKTQAAEMRRRREEGLPGPAWHVHPYVFSRTPQSQLMDHLQSLTLEH
jgi:phosphatidylserine/phosphatidylglycerophosphate/cardiolipin synthase-like enzyme